MKSICSFKDNLKVDFFFNVEYLASGSYALLTTSQKNPTIPLAGFQSRPTVKYITAGKKIDWL
jgi:hypothetical protein